MKKFPKIKVFIMRGGEAIIESLKRMGVNTIFGYPGGQTIPFYGLIGKSGRTLRPHHICHKGGLFDDSHPDSGDP